MKKLLSFFVGLLFFSCIDRINIAVPDSYTSQLVVDGLITDEPGPYTVNLSKSARVEKFLEFDTEAISSAKVTIFDNVGNSELLTEKNPGKYETKQSGIQGVVGREYSIKIETKDGKIYKSIPDRLNPVGELDSLYYEFESFLPFEDQTRYGFRFYVDAQGLPGNDNFLRWKFTEVFQIYAEPKLHIVNFPEPCTPSPSRCSGWIVNSLSPTSGLTLQKVGDCNCCTCWVTRYEDRPRVSDDQFISNGKVKKIPVGYVPLEYFPFQEGKYRVEVKQMSLSRQAFDYWRIIQAQKEGAASLFQPPTGKIRTNISTENGDEQVQGFFHASSVKTKQVYLGFKDIKAKFSTTPFWDCEVGIIAQDCRLAFPNSSTQPPSDWK